MDYGKNTKLKSQQRQLDSFSQTAEISFIKAKQAPQRIKMSCSCEDSSVSLHEHDVSG